MFVSMGGGGGGGGSVFFAAGAGGDDLFLLVQGGGVRFFANQRHKSNPAPTAKKQNPATKHNTKSTLRVLGVLLWVRGFVVALWSCMGRSHLLVCQSFSCRATAKKHQQQTTTRVPILLTHKHTNTCT